MADRSKKPTPAIGIERKVSGTVSIRLPDPEAEGHRITNESGERNLVLDLAELREAFGREFEKDEVPTRKYGDIKSLDEMRARISSSIAFSAGMDFAPAVFAASIIAASPITHERERPNMYYILEDRLGNQYRLYI